MDVSQPADLPVARPDWALFLDFDGTLVEIAETPDAVRAERRLVGILQSLSAELGGALAIVSGRPLAEVDAHLAPERFPAAGLHGLELRSAAGGPVMRPDGLDVPCDVRSALASFAGLHGLLLEEKGIAVALHYRSRPELADACRAAARRAIAGHPGLHALDGKMVVEIKPCGADKGRAVARLMAGAPFAGRVPVFAGDDVTDEDGFRAVAEMGGFGVKVGPGETGARHRVASVASFLGWLAHLEASLGRDGEVADR